MAKTRADLTRKLDALKGRFFEKPAKNKGKRTMAEKKSKSSESSKKSSGSKRSSGSQSSRKTKKMVGDMVAGAVVGAVQGAVEAVHPGNEGQGGGKK